MWLYSEIRTLDDIPRHYARTNPDRPALIDGRGPVSWSDLDRRSNQVAQLMVKLGVARGDRVAVLGKNGRQNFELLFGVNRISAALVPLNWRLAPPELVDIIADARPAVLLADAEYAETAARVIETSGVPCRVIGYDSTRPGVSELDELLAAAPAVDPATEVNPWHTAVLMYTSGTTGKPKGVQLSHQNYLYLRLCEHLEPSFSYTSDDVMLTVVPLFHAMGVGLSLQALYNGAAVAVYPMPTPGELLELIAHDRPTILPLVPTVIQMMLNQPGAATVDLSCVRVVVYAGAAMPLPLLQRALTAMDCDFIQFYGGTETCAGVTFLRPEQHRQGVKLESCGSPLPLIEIKVADPNGKEVADGEVGEFLIRSPSLTTGYFNQPELTAAAFPDGWYRSGDAGYRDADGFLYLVDRVKDMIITGGENVYSTEVENALARIDGVQQCAAIGVPDEKWGERVVAVVVLAPSAALTEEDIIARCRQFIAGYKLPKEVRFANALPMTATGKVMKNRLREQVRQGGTPA
ncbi:long-chain-fatty-acid--CoA ligase [Saccharopolyspora endophytica]|uniref:Long-chain-fatty-acid--CoA ligase n=1 Tax=Saccharopolyspora endophytica TaxID=543886 RepID=A0ABS5DB45_9PSEU|nr:long-chain-fatty-acid--CoA ligase [Saccharopolyspora endophytica]MBQ0923489.1 long-chain-fatty-acid--CoA ligase [Saccharopolyspora endophytica]